MSGKRDLDCVVIGYNELPFTQYEELLRKYGEDSEAYRDFRLSFVEMSGQKRLYADLMNQVSHIADGGKSTDPAYPEVFKSGDIPNLAAVYLTTFLARRGFRTRFINLFQSEKDRLAAMLEQNPLFVAITTTFYVFNFPVIDMVEFIRSRSPETKIVVGGPLIANHARNYEGKELESTLNDLGADIYVVESQGENTLANIATCLKEGGDLKTVPNILYYDDDKSLQKTPAMIENNDMDENYIDWAALAEDVGDLGPTLQTRTARSCAFSCAFCNYPTRAGKLTLTSIDVLRKELDSMRSLGNVENVVFIDDTFNVPIRRFKELCRMMIEEKYNFNWYSYFRCSNADDEAIELAAESGCKGVFLGIESGSSTILEKMNKKSTISKYSNGIQKLHDCGITTFGSFITGFPGESPETIRETTDFIRDSKLDFYRSQLWYNEEGTPIQQKRDEYEISGEGFVWNHVEMDSMEAMDEIERMFLTIDNAVWLPQFSFDFWIIPYLRGRKVSMDDFKKFSQGAQKAMSLGIASLPPHERARHEKEALDTMVGAAQGWHGQVV